MFGEKQNSGKGQLSFPQGLTVDSKGNIYVADRSNNCIQVFTSEGDFMRVIGKPGKAKDELKGPLGIAIDTEDNVYVGEIDCRVSVFNSMGAFVTSFCLPTSELAEFSFLAVDDCKVLYVCDYCNGVRLF